MYIPSPTIPGLIDHIARIEPNRFPVLLIGEEDPINADDLCTALRQAGHAFIGGIFPRVIFGEETSTQGVVLLSIPSSRGPILVRDLSNAQTLGERLADLQSIDGDVQALLVFIDGLASNIGEFLGGLFGRYGSNLAYFGGGAGSLSLQQQPAILTTEGVFQDAAVILPIYKPTHLGVRHGWQRLAGPLVASRTDKNRILELNWQNAFEVYRNTVEPVVGVSLSPENFFQHAKGFPFGMSRDGCEDVVRDPISVNEDGHLFCVGEVAQHSVLHILTGEPKDLLDAASQAGADCPAVSPNGYLLVDCISRNLFLGDRFGEELAAVRRGNQITGDDRLVGALTLGEISSIGGGYLEFLNKTIVFAEFGGA